MKPEAVGSGTRLVYSKRSPRREHRLLADHAFAADFLLAARGVGDDPVPRPQLHGLLAGIGDDDGVGPEILPLFGRRTFRQEVRFDGDFDLAGDGAVHAGDLSQIVRHHIEKFRRNQSPRRHRRLPWSDCRSRFQHSSDLKRDRAALNPVTCLHCRAYLSGPILSPDTLRSCKRRSRPVPNGAR